MKVVVLIASLLPLGLWASPDPIAFGPSRDLGCAVILNLWEQGLFMAPKLSPHEQQNALDRGRQFLVAHGASQRKLNSFSELERSDSLFTLSLSQSEVESQIQAAHWVYFENGQSTLKLENFVDKFLYGYQSLKSAVITSVLLIAGLKHACNGNVELGICLGLGGAGFGARFLNGERSDPYYLHDKKFAFHNLKSTDPGFYMSSEFRPRHPILDFFFSSETYRNFKNRGEVPLNRRVRIDWFAEPDPHHPGEMRLNLFIDAA